MVLQGAAVAELPDDLQQLEAATISEGKGWQLQSLKLLDKWTKLTEYRYSHGVLCAESCSSKTSSDAMTRLTRIFLSLQQLTVQMPPIGMQQIVLTAKAAPVSCIDESEESDSIRQICGRLRIWY